MAENDNRLHDNDDIPQSVLAELEEGRREITIAVRRDELRKQGVTVLPVLPASQPLKQQPEEAGQQPGAVRRDQEQP